MVQRIEFCTGLKLLQVVQAGYFVSLRLGQRERRQQDRKEKGDNRDDDQQLDQREGRAMPSDQRVGRRAFPRVRDLVVLGTPCGEHNWRLSSMSHPAPNTKFLISDYIRTHCSCNPSKYYLILRVFLNEP